MEVSLPFRCRGQAAHAVARGERRARTRGGGSRHARPALSFLFASPMPPAGQFRRVGPPSLVGRDRATHLAPFKCTRRERQAPSSGWLPCRAARCQSYPSPGVDVSVCALEFAPTCVSVPALWGVGFEGNVSPGGLVPCPFDAATRGLWLVVAPPGAENTSLIDPRCLRKLTPPRVVVYLSDLPLSPLPY